MADVIDRWYSNYSGYGGGLYGGTWSYEGDKHTTYELRGVRLAQDLAVSGTVTWARLGHSIVANLVIRRTDAHGHVVAGSALNGTLRATWDSRARGAVARIDGTLGGHAVHAVTPAP